MIDKFRDAKMLWFNQGFDLSRAALDSFNQATGQPCRLVVVPTSKVAHYENELSGVLVAGSDDLKGDEFIMVAEAYFGAGA